MMKTTVNSSTDISITLDNADINKGYSDWIDKVRKEFSRHGFEVSDRALFHNYKAWQLDFKSGCRDDGRGYHIFTPCGCNPLSFRLTALSEEMKDWQQTYIV